MREKAVVDRIVDGQHAVLLVGEDEIEHVVPVEQLPEEAAEGAWLQVAFEGDRLVEVTLDVEETERTRQRIDDKMAQLRGRPRHFRPINQEEIAPESEVPAGTTLEVAAEEQWTAVDRYLTDLFVPPDPALDAAVEASAAAGLPAIQVAPIQGKLLHLLAQLQGARTILEIGTLGGYSAIWLARALPADGQLITLEADRRHAEVARANIARAGLDGVVEVRLGPALEALPQLLAQGHGPFDFIFIDADKPAYPDYFTWALKLTRRGSVIVADNVVRRGAVVDSESSDPDVQGVRRFNELVAAEPRVSATALQTVGAKGYDGLVIALVTGDP
jgi:predicted O-methyltransferase YrrM